MSNWYTDVIQKDRRYTSVNPVTDVMLLEPTFRAAVTAIVLHMKSIGETFQVGETYRSRQRQRYLYDKGVTKLQNVGVHHYGLAVDLIRLVDGVYDPIGEHYKILRQPCVANKIVWGGDWAHPEKPHTFRDWDHVQRVGIEDQAALFAGAWYPDAHWNPASVG